MTDRPAATSPNGPAGSPGPETLAPPPARLGMRCIDTTRNPRIPVAMELVGALSRASTPQEVLSVFSKGVRDLSGPRGYISLSVRGLTRGQYRITRLIHAEEYGVMQTADPWSTYQSIEIHDNGFLAGVIQSAYPELIHHLDVQDDPVLGDFLQAYHSLLAIPLFDEGEITNWAVLLSEDPEGFTEEQMEDQILRANLVGGTVKRTLMAQRLREANDAAAREVERIAGIQRALLPDQLPEIPGVSIAASYETFDRAGGDLYVMRPLRASPTELNPSPDGPWGILIADASGHGPAAAVVSAILHAIIHAYPHPPEGPAELLAHANAHLVQKRIESSFVTAFFAIYDPKTRRLQYSSAGHNPPIIKHVGETGPLKLLDAVGSLPLGIVDGVEFEEAEVTLEPDTTLVLYTDGVTESMNPTRKMFGMEGIDHALEACSGESHCVIHSILSALADHEAGARPADDRTILAMQILPEDR